MFGKFKQTKPATLSRSDQLQAIFNQIDKLDYIEQDLKRLVTTESDAKSLQESISHFKQSLATTNAELSDAKQEISILKTKCPTMVNLKMISQNLLSNMKPWSARFSSWMNTPDAKIS